MSADRTHSLPAICYDSITVVSSILALNLGVCLLFKAIYIAWLKATIKHIFINILYLKVVLFNSMFQFIDNNMQSK